jgi:hypothetical protein
LRDLLIACINGRATRGELSRKAILICRISIASV